MRVTADLNRCLAYAQSETPRRPAPPWRRRMLVDLTGPAVFVLFYVATGRLTASTWALCAGSTVAMTVGYVLDRRLAAVPVTIACATALSAALSSVFADPSIITLEATISHVVAAIVMLGGPCFGVNVLKFVLGDYVSLPDATWARLALRLGLFALLIAAVNEVVRDTQPESVWVAFKIVGYRLLHVLFLLSQLPMIIRDHKREAEKRSS